MNLISTKQVNFNGVDFNILTFIIEQPDGLAVEYWYMPKNYGKMYFSYGEMVKDHLKYNKSIEADTEYIADTIDWDEIEL
jgi:hypothetical protein